MKLEFKNESTEMDINLRKYFATNINTIESIYIQFDYELLKNDENLMLKKFPTKN